jgi:hypothetical protein
LETLEIVMPSPFPGMNPYLEQDRVWHDFHQRFIPATADALGRQVDPRYVVRIDEHVYIRELPEELLSYVEVRDRDNWQLVTVIELLSPSNKVRGDDREQYLAKRSQLLSSPVHFVEIDLLRGAPRLPLRNMPECSYYAMVSRVEQRPRAGVWPVRLSERLPVIPVPVRAPDADARLDLQGVLHRVYDAARYQTYIYLTEPQPRLSPEDAGWARQYIPAPPS